MKKLLVLAIGLTPPAFCRPYHDHVGRDVAIGVAIGIAATPLVPINTGPVAALVPSAVLGGPPQVAPVADEIAKMATLRDRGIISEREFQQQKAKLLGGAQ